MKDKELKQSQESTLRATDRERGPVSEGPVGVLMNRLFLLINVSTRAAEAGGGGGGGDPDKGCPVAVRDTQEDLRR